MKLRNKKTGEIGYLIVGKGSDHYVVANEEWDSCGKYHSLTELNEEWEDYEKPKEYWYIDYDGGILCGEIDNSSAEKMMISMGNHFNSIEEAEKAVEKLKAWKRLKDRGIRIESWTIDDGLRISICTNIDEEDIYDEDKRRLKPDLDLLFGGEE